MGNTRHFGKGSFTCLENTIFYNRNLSAKAKGIYCQIRSLEGNPKWVFTIKGLSSLMRDGPDSVASGIKELESAGFIIRARARLNDGRFASAEESIWMTLDDPLLAVDAVKELEQEGYAVISKMPYIKQSPSSVVDGAAKSALSDNPASQKAKTGKSSIGQSAPIKYLKDKSLNELNPNLTSSEMNVINDGELDRTDHFPEEFEQLCEISIKPIRSLRYKRDCLLAWKRRLEKGFTPEALIDAYVKYKKSYEVKNGNDITYAKNLVRWLNDNTGDNPDAVPNVQTLKRPDNSPLEFQELVEASPEFGKLYEKATKSHNAAYSLAKMDNPDIAHVDAVRKADSDATFQRRLKQCEDVYDRYRRILSVLDTVSYLDISTQ